MLNAVVPGGRLAVLNQGHLLAEADHKLYFIKLNSLEQHLQ